MEMAIDEQVKGRGREQKGMIRRGKGKGRGSEWNEWLCV